MNPFIMNIRPSPTAPLHPQSGFTLIEVLVSILLMTLTLLGLAGLLGVSTRMQLGLETRSTANQMMNDLGNRIRANLDTSNAADRSTWAKHYTDLAVLQQNWETQQSPSSTPGTNCLTATCTRAQMADFDVAEIRTQMSRAMPQPALLMSGDAQAGMRITFAWFDKDFTAIGTDNAVELQTSPTCTDTDSGARALSCCPGVVAAADGVRCLNLDLRP